MDYTGPLFIKKIYSRSNRLFKHCFLLITCAATRLVHIELTSGFMSQSFESCIFILELVSCYPINPPLSWKKDGLIGGVGTYYIIRTNSKYLTKFYL